MPRLVMVGVSHHLTPLEVRECLAFDTQRWYAHSPRGLPSVLVSTCNRVEVYAWVTGRSAPAVRALQRSLADAASLDLADKPVVVLGAGVMARAAAESLVAEGARVRLLNRTPGHAEALAAQLGGEVSIGSLDDLPRSLEEAVLIVAATASRVPIVEIEAVRRAVARRHGRPL